MTGGRFARAQRIIGPPRSGWERAAACKGTTTPQWWFATTGQDKRNAVAKCRECRVRVPCLDYALACEAGTAVAVRFGIYGGMTPAQRLREERRRLDA